MPKNSSESWKYIQYVSSPAGQPPDFVRRSKGKYTVTGLNYANVFITFYWFGGKLNICVSSTMVYEYDTGSAFSARLQGIQLTLHYTVGT